MINKVHIIGMGLMGTNLGIKLVEPVALAAIAAGADGLLIEIHPRPDEALCDGPQALLPNELKTLIDKTSIVAKAVGRSV